MAKQSDPSPLLTGSTMASVAAAAMAASTALPPLARTQPGLGGQGLQVATTLRANTGIRVVG